ncbi:hypothetical protein N008_02480 [Hymenobacter sp. APR13]|nr:hypothetical protein N008_02480 [Hymenobacter sp. APR13]
MVLEVRLINQSNMGDQLPAASYTEIAISATLS